MMQIMRPKLQSPPIKCFWAGWHSDTYSLAQAGWQISAEERINDLSLSIMIRNPKLQAYGMSNIARYEYYKMKDKYSSGCIDIPLSFNMQLAKHIRIMSHGHEFQGRRWMPVDPYPSFRSDNYEEFDLNYLALFRYMPKEDRDIILEKPSFDEVLNIALEHQAPKQKELREKARRRTGAIISLAA